MKETIHEQVEFVGSIFIATKSDGGVRLILNLKKIHEFVKYEHFKMDGIKTIPNVITKKCYMASMDLKDTYYSVRISKYSQKFLKSQWKNKLFCFICFPNGLASSPR